MRNQCLSYILISETTEWIFINLILDGVYPKSCHVNLVLYLISTTLLQVNLNKIFHFVYKVSSYKINLYMKTHSVLKVSALVCYIQRYRLLDFIRHLILMKEHNVSGTGSVSVLMSVTGDSVGASLPFHLRTGTNVVTKVLQSLQNMDRVQEPSNPKNNADLN